MSRARTIDRALGTGAWAIMAIGLGADVIVSGAALDPNRVVLLVTLVVFFATILLRLGLALRARSRRRVSIGFLLLGLVLWAAESAVLASQGTSNGSHNPTIGEWLFVASYLAMVIYLLTDTEHRATYAFSTWLEAAVVCGGCALLAGSVLLTPVASRYGAAGLPMLVAMLYPVADLILALLVLGQVAMRMRSRDWPVARLFLGFVLLAVADASFVSNVTTGSHGSTRVVELFWGAGFALIVGAACRTRPDAPMTAPRGLPAAVLTGAATVAIVVLAVHPSGRLGPYLAVAAVVTLLAAGGRLVLALREANGAAEAFALARTDDLTMLPNRRAVMARLDEHIAHDRPLGLMIMDLDGFKDINDTLGHVAGDAVLKLAARRMREALPPTAMIARLGGDEFAVVVSDDDEISLLEIAGLVLKALGEPNQVDGLELVVTASLGIAVREGTDRTSSSLLRRADVAMYQAKLTGTGALIYDASRDDFSRTKLQLAEELRRGIPEGQLVLWYQPQIDAASQRVCGLEALVRWQHPERGLMPPIAFLPAARHAGLMLALSDAVARQAIADMQRWRHAGLRIRVALNCAPPELLSGAFVPRLMQAIRESEIEPDDLMIEVTEDSFLADPERTRTILSEIRSTGLQIAIDDYGTGFSSLTYLRDLPVDELKIDRSFVSTMPTDERSVMIVESTLQMAHALGLRFVAEGVEDAATSAALVAMGVDVLQGYHLARPMPSEQVIDWISGWTAGNGIASLNGDTGSDEIQVRRNALGIRPSEDEGLPRRH
ncbi:MAG TPA: EAL domain-containing protein [Jatrophihabitans sp.]